jgi:two-component system phosphate regulon sensor histidine kinase PhoR
VRDPSFVAFMTSARFEEPLVFRPLARPSLVLSVGVIEFEPARSIVITRDVTKSERVDAMRRDFVANVSHELKTPLTVLSGFLETIRELPVTEAQRNQYLGLMHAQAHRMENIVEDLLVLSKLESTNAPAQEDEMFQVPPVLE